MFFISFISRWRLFKKMGYPGWAGIIPVYNEYLLFKRYIGSIWLILIPILMPIVCALFGLAMAVLGYLATIGLLLFWGFMIAAGITHDFGKGGWWTFGTLFMFPVMEVVYGISTLKFRNGESVNKEYDVIDGIFDFFEGQKYKRRLKRVPVPERQMYAGEEDRKCPECGSVLRENAKFCTVCGKEIS